MDVGRRQRPAWGGDEGALQVRREETERRGLSGGTWVRDVEKWGPQDSVWAG